MNEAVEQRGSKRDIVAIGGSSGALQALEFLGQLPSEFPAAIFVVVHAAPGSPGLLPAIIRRYSTLPVEPAHDGEAVKAGRIYVAPPDQHLSLNCGGVLRQIEDDKMLRFKCRVGHALSEHTLLAAQSDNIEKALWTALRALESRNGAKVKGICARAKLQIRAQQVRGANKTRGRR
jgi:chemotaxis response regulator CheB